MRQRFEDSEESGYLASVSDLLVGLLFIFIIILMAFGLSFRNAQSNADTSLAALEIELEALQAEKQELIERQEALLTETERLAEESDRLQREEVRLGDIVESFTTRNASRRTMLENIQSLLAGRDVPVSIVPENGVLRLPEELLFETASADLREEAEPALRVLAETLARVLPCHSLPNDEMGPDCSGDATGLIETVLIEGHTDDRPITGGPFRDNWELAAERGTSVFKRLTELQPSLNSLTNANGEALLGVSSYEARRPVRQDESDEALRMNRRIDIRFLILAPSDEQLQSISSSIQ